MKIISSRQNRPIAFFDSGVGGLTVMSKLRTMLPDEDFLYFGDTLNMPYGEKSKAELLGFADKIFVFFAEKNAKAVVMACNTTSSVIYDEIKDKYDIKIYPVIQSVSKIFAKMPVERFGVFATKATVDSNAYKTQIQKYKESAEVFQIACPQWVRLVEENRVNDPESRAFVAEKMDEMLRFNPEKIILGCTHYPYLLDKLSEFAPREIFIDPAEFFAEFISEDLRKNGLTEKASGFEEVFVSANPDLFENSARRFWKLKRLPDLVKL